MLRLLMRSILGLAILVLAIEKTRAQQPVEADRLNEQVIRLYQAQKFAEAIPIAERVLALRQRASGAEHPDLITPLRHLGELYRLTGRYAAAEMHHKRSLAIGEKFLGAHHALVATSLHDLAGLYRDQGRFAEAEPLQIRSLRIREQTQGPNHPSVAASLHNLAGLYQRQSRYADAEHLLRRALTIRENSLGREHPEVGLSLNNLALLHYEQGNFAEAERLFKRGLEIHEKAYGTEHLFVALSLVNIAGVHQVQGRYADAEPLYKRGLAIREKFLGPDHPDVGMVLNNLGVLYGLQERFADAETQHKRSLAIREKALGSEHHDVATSLINLGLVYTSQGRLDEVEGLLKRGLEIMEKTLGPENPQLGGPLDNLAALYQSQRRNGEAEHLHKRSLAIREKALGPEHPSIAVTLELLAMLYRTAERTTDAEGFYRRSLNIREKALRPDHPLIAKSLNHLGVTNHALGHHDKAKQFLERSMRVYEGAFGTEHPMVAQSLNNLARIALEQGNLLGSADYWRRATSIIRRAGARSDSGVAQGSPEGEAERKSIYFNGLIKTSYRLAIEGRQAAIQASSEMFEAAQWSQSSDAAGALAQMAARSAGGSRVLSLLVRERQDLLSELQQRDKLFIAAMSKPPSQRSAASEKELGDRLAAIKARLTAIDSRLSTEFPEYADLASPKAMSVANVQASLHADEALVLFLDTDARFKPLPEETFVWVVTNKEARWLRSEIGTAALRREVAALRCGLDATAWHGQGKATCAGLLMLPFDKIPREGAQLPFDAARAHSLYKGLFRGVEDLIKGKHLLVVPSGALTTLPLQVLVTEAPNSGGVSAAGWMIRDHALTVLPSVSSLASLRRIGRASAARKPMIGVANPLLDGDQRDPAFGVYYKQQADAARARKDCARSAETRTAELRRMSRSPRSGMLAISRMADVEQLRIQTPLPETAEEVCVVARAIGADVDEMLIGARANETEIKRLSVQGELAQYRILHFATHGTLAGQLSGTSEPGLILTPPDAATENDDGYLSGSEIAAQKLDADWVILSACNTAGGSGEGEAAEALSGLARMFFYAGARALLVSHWEVDSNAAVKLVTGAVGALSSDKSVGRAEAMRRSILSVMTDTERPAAWIPAWHPSVWAPFVVVGEGGVGR